MVKRLPRVGIEAVLLMKDFKKSQKEYSSSLKQMEQQTRKTAATIITTTKDTSKVFSELERRSASLSRILSRGTPTEQIKAYQDLGVALKDLGVGTKINVDLFDKFLDQGIGITDSLEAATGSASGAGVAMRSLAAGAAIVSTAIGTSIAVVRNAVNEYTDFAEQVRTIRFELGASAQEASGWIRAAESAGLSTTSLQRGVTSVSKKLLDYKLAVLEGKDSSNQFTRALDALNVPLEDANGTMRSAEEVMQDVNDRLRELGPGTVTTAAAMDVYGYAGRDMLRVILDQSGSMEELQKRALELGATTTVLAQEQYEEWRAATGELQLATQGIKNYMATQWIPVLTELAKITTRLIDGWRRLIAILAAVPHTLLDIITGQEKANDILGAYARNLQRLLGIEDEARAKEEALAQARNKAAQDALIAAQAEQELAKQRTEALAEIEQDRLDLIRDFLQKEEDIRREYARKFIDLIEEFRRDDIITAIKQDGQREDLLLKHNQKIADLERKSRDRVTEIRDELAKDLARFDEDAARKREKLLNRHLDNMWKIRNRYLDTVQEAARDNDAVAVVRAMRVQAQQRRDENYRYAREQSELEKDLAIKRKRLIEDADERKAKAEQDRQDEIARENDRYNQQLALLEQKFARQRRITELQRQWERDDLNTAKRRELEDLRIWYRRELDELNAQVSAMQTATSQGIASIGAAAAAATGAAVQQILNTVGQRIQAVGGGVLYHTGSAASEAARSASVTGGSAAIDQWYRGTQRGGYRAEGGVDVVNRPTSFVAGERGSEVAAFIPLHNMHHTFGKMDVGFNGLPSGANTSQVESIVYDVMVKVAQAIGEGKR